jgi:molybdopterin molybdotransferase
VAALVSFYMLLREPLLRLAGAEPQPLPRLSARLLTPLRKRAGRTEFLRARVQAGDQGGWEVRPTASQSSAVLRSMSEANALIVLPEAITSVEAGEWVEVCLFEGLI